MATTAALLLLLIFSQQSGTVASSNIQSSSASTSYADHGFALLNKQDIVSITWLNSMTAGIQSVQAYEQLIATKLIPSNIRMVLLDIGWQNYTVGKIQYEQWVANWLTASDIEGIQNVFFLSQLTQEGVGSNWIMSLIHSDPYTQTAYSNGTMANYVSYDNPDVATAVDSDLSILYSFYGVHQSWVGIGTGTVPDSYNFTAAKLPIMGYSNSTLRLFSASSFFNGESGNNNLMTKSGPNLISNEFLNITDLISLTSGNLGSSAPFDVYSNYTLAMRFPLKSNEQSISVQWYGREAGDAGPLTTAIYKYDGGDPNSTVPVSLQADYPNQFTASVGWQTPLQYSSDFSSGYYWIVFSCQSCNQSNGYDIYVNSNYVSGQDAQAFSRQYYGGAWQSIGSSILWIKESTGSNLAIYPYKNGFTGGVSMQSFVAPTPFSFNTVFLYLNQQPKNPAIGTLKIIDQITKQTLASANLSQSEIKGMQGWVPFQLNQIVNTTKGIEYSIEISETDSSRVWSNSFWGVNSNPGFQNQTRYLLFRLSMMNIGESNLDYTSIGQTTSDSIVAGHLDAVGFTPSIDETLTSVAILMRNQSSKAGNYTSGSLDVSIERGDSNGTMPSSEALQTVSVSAGDVPQNALLNVSGFDVPVQKGKTYWVVLSSSIASPISLAVLGNPYLRYEVASQNNGTTWNSLTDGDLAIAVAYANGNAGKIIENIKGTTIDPTKMLAQPFIAVNNSKVVGVYLGPISRVQSSYPNDYLSVTIRPDNGNNTPSGYILAQGKYYGDNMSFSGSQVSFGTITALQKGQKYWIVLQPVNGTYSVTTDYYSNSSSLYDSSDSALLSIGLNDTWRAITGGAADFAYTLMTTVVSVPEYSTTQLLTQLSTVENSQLNDTALQGWNAFLQSARLWTFQSITAGFDKETGRTWAFYATIAPSIAGLSGANGDVINLYGSQSPLNCTSLIQYLLYDTPGSDQQFQNVGNSTLLRNCNLSIFLTQSKYMSYVGHSFGSDLAQKTLVVGDLAQPDNLTDYLSNLYNVTYLPLSRFQNIITTNNLSSFDTLVWLVQKNETSSTTNYAIASYVFNGGNLIVLQNPTEWLTLVENYGLTTGRTNGTVFSLAKSISAITNHTSYYKSLSSEVLTNESGYSIARGPGLVIEQTTHGNGIAILLSGGQSISSVSQTSSMTTLVANTISLIQYGFGPSK